MGKKLLLLILVGCFCAALYAQDNPSQNNSDGNPPINQQDLGFISDSRLLFNAMGGTDSHIQVTCQDGWFSVNSNDWLDVTENGEHLVVRCHPNPYSRTRIGQINIVGARGTRTGSVTVQQDAAGIPPSKPTAQTTIAVSNVENQSVHVKVSFEAGKAAPSFENVWSTIRLLESDNSLGLQIDIPWCRNEYDVDLIENRVQNITDYFIASGIEKSRISSSINLKGAAESNMECDRAYLKIVSH